MIDSNPGDCCPDTASCAPLPPPQQGADDDERLADLARAIAHPLRVHILRRLSAKNQCICADVVNDLGLPQSTVSQHLKVLLDAGLVAVSVEGRTRRYCLHPQGLRELRTLIVNL
ncbi:MAG: transcriptional regulator [Planctomycetota bacterium]|nr:MAG: transcriptional regulator [Planctomycetota bacterium]